jgi:hypothetical protein
VEGVDVGVVVSILVGRFRYLCGTFIAIERVTLCWRPKVLLGLCYMHRKVVGGGNVAGPVLIGRDKSN